MSDAWYLSRIREYDDSFAADWELSSLEQNGGNSASVMSLDHGELLPWAQKQAIAMGKAKSDRDPSSAGGFAIL